MTSMTATATSPTATVLDVGDRWELDVDQVDDDGNPVGVAPVVLVTLPDGSTTSPTATQIEPGWWRATYTPAAAGRYVATVTGAGDVVTFAAYAAAITPAAGMPTLADVTTYLGASAASWADAELSAVLDAEAAAQRAVCVVGGEYPPDLRAALLRRVARALAMRRLPLAMPAGDGEGGGPTILPGTDPEVRRLERPHRRIPVA